MKKDARERNPDRKVMAYININKKVTDLSKMGLLEEIKPDPNTVNIHGRKDYKVTMKGMEDLILHCISQSEDFEPISKYIYKSGLDRKAFENILNHKIFNMFSSVNSYFKITGQMVTLPSEYISNIQIKDIKEPKPVTMTATTNRGQSKTIASQKKRR